MVPLEADRTALPTYGTGLRGLAAYATRAASRLIRSDRVQVLLLQTEGTFASSCNRRLSVTDFSNSRM